MLFIWVHELTDSFTSSLILFLRPKPREYALSASKAERVKCSMLVLSAIRALILFIYRDSMELMATPRASAISSISGAAVPEEILSMRVREHARALERERARGADALVRCNAGCIQGSGMRHEDAMRQIYLPGPERSWERGEEVGPRYSRIGGQSHRWKKVRKVKSEVN